MPIVGVQANFVVLVPSTPSGIPNNSVFVDSTNGNAATFKDNTGATTVVTNPAASFLSKQMQAYGPIPVNSPVSKRTDGYIELADANAVGGMDLIGWNTQAAIAMGDLITVICVGPNLVGAITGLGFAVGDEVYVSETGGYTNDPSTLTNMDAIIKVGVADCAAGVASATATDLVCFPDVVAST